MNEFRYLESKFSFDPSTIAPMKFSLGGINCSNCCKKIEKALSNIEGITSSNASAITYRLFVNVDRYIGPESVIECVEGLGFRCEYIPSKKEKLGKVELEVDRLMPSNYQKFEQALMWNLEGVEKVQTSRGRALINFDSKVLKTRTIIEYLREETEFNNVCILSKSACAVTKNHQYVEKRRMLLALSLGLGQLLLTLVLPYLKHEFLTEPCIGNRHISVPVYIIVVALLASVMQFYFGLRFYKAACSAFKHCSLTMDVLVVIGTTVAYAYGVTLIFLKKESAHQVHENAHLFETSSLLIAIVIVGKYLEAYAKRKARKGLQTLASITVPSAILFNQENEEEREIDANLLEVGDIVKIYNGAIIPVDGKVVRGRGTVNEAILTGESEPVPKQKGDTVMGGTLLIGGSLFVQATSRTDESTSFKIMNLVEEAQNSKPPIQSVADKVSCFFVPLIIILGIITWTIWITATFCFSNVQDWAQDQQKSPLTFATEFGIAVIVISCPCALGLATPAVVMVASSMAARMGILIKGGRVLQSIKEVKTIIFDKTGTLTQGTPNVKDFLTDFLGIHKHYFLSLAYTIEKSSEHPLAKAITRFCQEYKRPYEMANFQTFAGQGVVGTFNYNSPQNRDLVELMEKLGSQEKKKLTVYLGNLSLLQRFKIQSMSQGFEKQVNDQEQRGHTTIYCVIAVKDKILGPACFSLRQNHESKEQAGFVLKYLKKKNYDIWMITGDNWGSALRVGKSLGIPKDRIIAQARPQQKKSKVEQIQRISGKKVMMIGDGVNDSPSLAQADVGVAINCSTDITVEAAEVVLMKNNLRDVPNMLWLCNSALTRIKMNFLWAFIYNVTLIPIAAGIFYPSFSVSLSPILASIAMSLSSISVILSSLMLRCKRAPFVTQ